MDDLNRRLERATDNVTRLLEKRNPFDDLEKEDRQAFTKELLRLHIEKKRLDIEEQHLDFTIRVHEFSQQVRNSKRPTRKTFKTSKCTQSITWLNGLPTERTQLSTRGSGRAEREETSAGALGKHQ